MYCGVKGHLSRAKGWLRQPCNRTMMPSTLSNLWINLVIHLFLFFTFFSQSLALECGSLKQLCVNSNLCITIKTINLTQFSKCSVCSFLSVIGKVVPEAWIISSSLKKKGIYALKDPNLVHFCHGTDSLSIRKASSWLFNLCHFSHASSLCTSSVWL